MSVIFDATWFAGGKLHTGTFGARDEQQLRDRLAYWWGRDCADFAKGDRVLVRGQWHEVLRVNAKSLTVPTGYTWNETIPYDEVRGRRAAEEA